VVFIVGHRGIPAEEPENTLRSVKRALEVGADYVEVDVRSSKDGYIVVIHDETVDRTSSGSGYVRDMTLNDLRRLDFGKGERIPLLSEVLELVRSMRGKLIVEIKETGIEDKVLDIIENCGMLGDVIIVSFIKDSIQRVHELCPAITTGVIFGARFRGNMVEVCKEVRAKYVVSKYTITTSEVIRSAHRCGLEVLVWTINDERNMLKFARMGVDGIATDNARLAVQLLKRQTTIF